MVAAVAAHPVVAVVLDNRGIDACSANFLAKVGNGNLQLGEVLKVDEEM